MKNIPSFDYDFDKKKEYQRNLLILNNLLVELDRRRNWKSLLQTIIRKRNGSEKSWFLQGNACLGNSSKLQSLTTGVCRPFTGMQS